MRAPQSDGYRLGPKVSALAKKAPQPSLGERISPFLQRLSREINETCGFYVQVGDTVEVVASAISIQALSYTMKIGARAPLYAVSAGKIALTELEPDRLKEYLARVKFAQHTPRTIHSKACLKREVQEIRASGFAYSREEFSIGITAVATAVRPGGKFIGAINVALPTVRFTSTRAKEFQEALRVTAIMIAEDLV
jgi:DNA-binding IclR family transcriptional regulator